MSFHTSRRSDDDDDTALSGGFQGPASRINDPNYSEVTGMAAGSAVSDAGYNYNTMMPGRLLRAAPLTVVAIILLTLRAPLLWISQTTR